ncbi:MAG: efflux RND transporter periplasmic adaptor subunit [Planctomycetota bacterium]
MTLRSLRWWRRILGVVLGFAAMAALLAWLMGVFHHRVEPGETAVSQRAAPNAPRLTASLRSVPTTEAAVGTIRAIQETSVASRILGRIKTLRVERAGQPVQQGEILVELESTDLQAAFDAARAASKAAEARRDQAKVDLERTQDLAKSGVASQARLDQDQSAFNAAQAEFERARQAEAGAETALSFATVRAPIGGIVVDKKVNAGDVVQPGQVLFSLYDPSRLQLVAVVREELAGRLSVGQEVDVSLDALGKQCRGSVAEIVPEAQARTRSFEVKVVGPCQPGIVTGMFGRLHVPLGQRQELRVPSAAVLSVGQLDFVYVVDAADAVQRRYVRTGRRSADDEVEILAGLTAGEVILADARNVEPR